LLIMKISRIALLAGLVRAAKPAYMQLAQFNASRAASEARGGDFKPKKAKKKSKKK
jgi:hypothetical protein